MDGCTFFSPRNGKSIGNAGVDGEYTPRRREMTGIGATHTEMGEEMI